MLKISVIDSGLRRKLVVEGELIAPWISELRTAWKMANRGLQSRELTIDIAKLLREGWAEIARRVPCDDKTEQSPAQRLAEVPKGHF
jgi:hypothetical protein